jgi:hypothetical protein
MNITSLVKISEDTSKYTYVPRKYPKISFSLTKPSFFDNTDCGYCGNKDVKISYSMNSIFYRLWLGHVALYKTNHCSKCERHVSQGGIVFSWLEKWDKALK